MTVAVRAENLTKAYGPLRAVDAVNLEVPAGATFGLIGPNGAGKSTTFSMIATLLAPSGGRLEVAGHDPVREPREVRRRLGYMPDVMGVYDNLTVEEYLQFFAGAYRLDKKQWPTLITGLLELVGLDVKRNAMVDSLSRGMKQRLSLARALIHDPEVLVLDEPASGLDPRARIDLRNLLAELRAMGKTIIISSHILSELAEMCSHVAIMEAGSILASGTPREIATAYKPGREVFVKLATGEERSYTVADDAEQAALVRHLVVTEGLPVVSVIERETSLEGIFLQVTEGRVQ